MARDKQGVLLTQRQPLPEKTHTVYLSFTDSQWSLLRRAAERQGVSVQGLLRRLLHRLAQDNP